MPTAGTINYVADTLPSDVGLTILVTSPVDQKLVYLPRVMMMLDFLKNNSPYYKDVSQEHFS